MKALNKTFKEEAIKKLQLSIPISYELYLIRKAAYVAILEKKAYNIQDVIRDLIKKDIKEFNEFNGNS